MQLALQVSAQFRSIISGINTYIFDPYTSEKPIRYKSLYFQI